MKVTKLLLFLGGMLSHVRASIADPSVLRDYSIDPATGESHLDILDDVDYATYHRDTNCYAYGLSECAPYLTETIGSGQKMFLNPGMIRYDDERGKEEGSLVPGNAPIKEVSRAVRQDLKRLGAKPLNATRNVKDPDRVPLMSEEADCQMAICTGDLNIEVKKAQSRGDTCFMKKHQETRCGVISDYHVFARHKGQPWTHKFQGSAVYMLPEGSHPLSGDVPAESKAGDPVTLRATKCYFIDVVKKGGEPPSLGRG